MSRWNREEIDTCFRRFMDITDRAFIEGDLEPWVQCFTCLLYTSDAADE